MKYFLLARWIAYALRQADGGPAAKMKQEVTARLHRIAR